MIEIAGIALVFLMFSLISRQLASTLTRASMFFLAAGLLLASDPVGLVRIVEL
jgi:hypothetical protein